MLGVSQKLLIGVSVAFLSINGIKAAHAYQVFNNREQWEAALSNPSTTFDFSSVAGENIPSGTVLPNGLAVSYLPSARSGGGTVSAVATTTGVSITGTREIGSGPILGLPSSVQAIGFDLTLTRGLAEFGNFLVEFPTIKAAPRDGGILKFRTSSGFFGFISDPDIFFNKTEIRCEVDDCLTIGGVAVDNISVSSAIQPVPEPSSTLGLSAAISVLLALKLKSKQQKYF
ncbi:MAG: PEP-CTERM sorting domain-containing protein [Rhizonema sp. PD37]|nr:PEP-CTERM sorting domain-containing protein [Rhizonema sp. PD37]